MIRVYVALGGNIGDTEAVFRKALHSMEILSEVEQLLVSSFYETEPVSPIPQRNYLNAVCSFNTSLPIRELFDALKQIEMQLGQEPKEQTAPRIIDLDLIFYGETTYSDEVLTVPHPRWKERSFVKIPLNELLEIETHAKCTHS